MVRSSRTPHATCTSSVDCIPVKVKHGTHPSEQPVTSMLDREMGTNQQRNAFCHHGLMLRQAFAHRCKLSATPLKAVPAPWGR